MDIVIKPQELNGEINSIPSKSDAHRILISAALSDRTSSFNLESLSEDILATIECIKSMGGKITMNGEEIKVYPIIKADKKIDIDFNESGSTMRFLIPLISALGIQAHVIGRGRLPNRAIKVLLDQLRLKGAEIDRDSLPLNIGGKLTAGTFDLAGNISSQYISGLLFALPLLEAPSSIRLTSELESAPYVEMTLNTLKKFGIDYLRNDKSFTLKENSKYKAPDKIEVEGDWSSACFWLTAGALSEQGITVTGLNLDSLQSDKAILNVLEDLGAEVRVSKGVKVDSVTVKKKNLKAFDFDASQAPDMVPVLASIMALCEGESLIYKAGRLRDKESDRLKAVSENLLSLGGQVIEKKEELHIKGVDAMVGGKVEAFNDHRIAMSAAIAAIGCKSKVLIKGAEAVNKSYPNFYKHYIELGGVLDVI